MIMIVVSSEFESKHKGELEAWIHSRKKRNRIVIAAFSFASAVLAFVL